jgi:hypothetical protein
MIDWHISIVFSKKFLVKNSSKASQGKQCMLKFSKMLYSISTVKKLGGHTVGKATSGSVAKRDNHSWLGAPDSRLSKGK